jgi:hypothetical protein
MGHLAYLVGLVRGLFLWSRFYAVFSFLSVETGPSLSPLLNTFCVFNFVGCSFSGSVKAILSCPPVLCRDSVQLTYAVVRMYLCMYARYHYVLLYYGVRSDHCLNTSIHTYILRTALHHILMQICSTSSYSRLPSYFSLSMSLDVGELGWAGQGQNS